MHRPPITNLLAVALGLVSADAISVTPHQQFASSIGVVGCHINTNRVAYFPSFPSCENPCVRLTHASGRKVTLLHIDSSGGAYDISYDAWNYLSTGQSATENPTTGGGIDAEMEKLPLRNPGCQALLQDEKIPIMAISPNWGLECPDSVQYWNFGKQSCSMGTGEACPSDVSTCKEGAEGAFKDPPPGMQVMDIEYATGREVPAQ